MTSLAIALRKASEAAYGEALHWKGTEYVRLRELGRVLEAEARVAAQKEAPRLISLGTGRFRYA